MAQVAPSAPASRAGGSLPTSDAPGARTRSPLDFAPFRGGGWDGCSRRRSSGEEDRRTSLGRGTRPGASRLPQRAHPTDAPARPSSVGADHDRAQRRRRHPRWRSGRKPPRPAAPPRGAGALGRRLREDRRAPLQGRRVDGRDRLELPDAKGGAGHLPLRPAPAEERPALLLRHAGKRRRADRHERDRHRPAAARAQLPDRPSSLRDRSARDERRRRRRDAGGLDGARRRDGLGRRSAPLHRGERRGRAALSGALADRRHRPGQHGGAPARSARRGEGASPGGRVGPLPERPRHRRHLGRGLEAADPARGARLEHEPLLLSGLLDSGSSRSAAG